MLTFQVAASSVILDAPVIQNASSEATTLPLGGFVPNQNKIVVDSFETLQLAEEILFGDTGNLPKAVGGAAHLRLVGVDCEVNLKLVRNKLHSLSVQKDYQTNT